MSCKLSKTLVGLSNFSRHTLWSTARCVKSETNASKNLLLKRFTTLRLPPRGRSKGNSGKEREERAGSMIDEPCVVLRKRGATARSISFSQKWL